MFPRQDPCNPYQRLLAAALRERGVEVVEGPRLTPLWALRVSRRDAVHLHWVEFLIFSPKGGPVVQEFYVVIRAMSVFSALLVLRLRRIPVVWTVHNLAPHEARWPRLERRAMALVARLTTSLHLHSRWAAERASSELALRTPRKIVVLRHGHYMDAYGPAESRAESRRKLGLPSSARVYLIFGAMREYKQIPEAIAAFGRLQDPDAVLLVSGRIKNDDLRSRIEAAAAKDPRVLLNFQFVPDDEVPTFYGAADVAILNYREVFSSGALMAALSFGVPVVAPAGGSTEEVAGPPAVETFAAGALTEVLEACRRGDPDERRRAALAAARRCDWTTVAAGITRAIARQA